MIENESEELISLKQILFLLKKNVFFILCAVLFCSLLGAIYGFFIKSITYETTITGMVEAEMPNMGANESSAYSYSVNLTNTFKVFAVSDPVITKAYSKLVNEYPDITKKQIKDSVTFNISQQSMIITLTAKSTNDELSKEIAKAVMDSAIECSNQLDSEGNPEYTILNNKLKEFPGEIETIATRGALKVVLIAACIGLVISLGIIILKYIINDTYTSKKDFEKEYNIDILASIPD